VSSESLLDKLPKSHAIPVAEGLGRLTVALSAANWTVLGRYAAAYWNPAVISNPQFNDLDIGTRSFQDLPLPDQVLPQEKRTGIYYTHRHLPNAQGLYFANIVDTAGVNTDIFTMHPNEPPPAMVPLNDRLYVPIRTAETQMVFSIEWLRRIATGYKFNYGLPAKYIKATRTLAEVANIDKIESIWQQCFEGRELGAMATLNWAEEQIKGWPSAQGSPLKRVLRHLFVPCAGCDRTDPNYPLISGFKAGAVIYLGRKRGYRAA